MTASDAPRPPSSAPGWRDDPPPFPWLDDPDRSRGSGPPRARDRHRRGAVARRTFRDGPWCRRRGSCPRGPDRLRRAVRGDGRRRRAHGHCSSRLATTPSGCRPGGGGEGAASQRRRPARERLGRLTDRPLGARRGLCLRGVHLCACSGRNRDGSVAWQRRIGCRHRAVGARRRGRRRSAAGAQASPAQVTTRERGRGWSSRSTDSDGALPGGAGDENRTRMTSLEGWGSAIELHPRGTWPAEVRGVRTGGDTVPGRGDRTRTGDLLLPKQTR